MKYSPEMIDGVTIQLRGALQAMQITGENTDIPKSVSDAASNFCEKLETWSDNMKAGKETE